MSSYNKNNDLKGANSSNLICSSFAIAICAISESFDEKKEEKIAIMDNFFTAFCPDADARKSYINSAKYSILDYRPNNISVLKKH